MFSVLPFFPSTHPLPIFSTLSSLLVSLFSLWLLSLSSPFFFHHIPFYTLLFLYSGMIPLLPHLDRHPYTQTLSALRKIDLLRLSLEFKLSTEGSVVELRHRLKGYLNTHRDTLYRNPHYNPLFPRHRRALPPINLPLPPSSTLSSRAASPSSSHHSVSSDSSDDSWHGIGGQPHQRSPSPQPQPPPPLPIYNVPPQQLAVPHQHSPAPSQLPLQHSPAPSQFLPQHHTPLPDDLPRECDGQPWGFPGQPAPVPVKTRTCVHGYGFFQTRGSQSRIWVTSCNLFIY